MLRLGNPLKDSVNNEIEQDIEIIEEDDSEVHTKISPSLKNKRKKDESSDEDDDDLDYSSLLEEKTEQERDLEDLVFGSIESSILSNIDKLNKSKGKKLKEKKLDSAKTEKPTTTKVEIADSFETRKPAWSDDADQEIVDLNQFNQFSNVLTTKSNLVTTSQIEESLKARYTKYYGTPMWADLDLKKKQKLKKKKKLSLKQTTGEESSDESDLEQDAVEDEDEQDDDESIFQHTGTFLVDKNKQRSSIPKGILDIKICTNANKEEPHQNRLKSVEFHPTARVMLTAGLGQKLSLFQIDGKKNPKIQSIFIEKFPILSAHFTKNGEEIILGSKHKNFYYFDMIAGKIVTIVPPVKALDEFQRPSISTNFEISPDNRLMAFVGSQGQIHLFSVKSKEWIDTLKINGECNTVTFSPDSRYLFAFGDDKDVNVFDMNRRGHECLHKFTDYGCLSGTSIAVSNNSQYLATGCKSGVVNLYNLNESILNNLKDRNPKPIKTFMNLTTPCTSLKFNSTSEILATCSAQAENACKLIHIGSMSVFSNFPLQNAADKSSIHSKMRIPTCIDFSLNSGYFAIGNQKGDALLYRLKHYGSY